MSAAARDEDGEPVVPGQAPTDPVTGKVLETDDIRADGLRQLRVLMDESIRTGKVARFVRTDDRFLLAFLRARKYNVAKAHMVLCNFTTMWYNPKCVPARDAAPAGGACSHRGCARVHHLPPLIQTARMRMVPACLHPAPAAGTRTSSTALPQSRPAPSTTCTSCAT